MSDDLVAVIAPLGGFAIAVAALQLLWNWLMPTIFGLPRITYWQAGGLMVMASLLSYLPRSSTSKRSD